MSLVDVSSQAKEFTEEAPLTKALTKASILSDRDIVRLITDKKLIIDPYSNLPLNTSSVDLKLGPILTCYLPQTIKSGIDKTIGQEIDITGSSYTLNPGEFILGMTKECISIPNGYLGVIETKGNIARAGILVHCNDAHIDAGFTGHITLEIINFNKEVSIELVPNTPICQLFVGKLSSECSSTYKGKYLFQAKPTTYRP